MVRIRLTSVLAVGMVMFLSMSLASAKNQGQGGRDRGGFGGSRVSGVLGLLNNEDVQKELNLDDATIASVKQILDAAGEEARTERGAGGGFAGLRDLPEAERRSKMQELQVKGAEIQAKITAKYQPQIKEALTPAQFERAQQIYWQSNTAQAFSDSDLIKALEVTRDQQDKIAAVGKEYTEKQRGLFGGGRPVGVEGAREKMAELNKERDTRVVDVLTADQKTKFASLKGQEFDVSKLRGARGGRRPPTEKKSE